MLFEFDTDPSELRSAQAALLLSHWSPDACPGQRRMDTVWLCIAIQYWKTILADGCDEYLDIESADADGTPSQNGLKRLWWCCIIRDRTISLYLRRNIQIDERDLCPVSQPTVAYADLADEIDHSQVYSSILKRDLVEVLGMHLKLYIGTTPLFSLLYPSLDVSKMSRVSCTSHASLEEYHRSLQRWADSALETSDKIWRGRGKIDDTDYDIISTFIDQAWLYYK